MRTRAWAPLGDTAGRWLQSRDRRGRAEIGGAEVQGKVKSVWQPGAGPKVPR